MDINKDLIAASSTPIVLAILAEEESYGYAILKRVRELSGGRMEWTDGMLYPVLHRLERLGHIEARWRVAENGRRRKYYRITSRGLAQLAEERRQWEAVDDTLRGIWRMHSVRPPAACPESAPPMPWDTWRALVLQIPAGRTGSTPPSQAAKWRTSLLQILANGRPSPAPQPQGA